MSWTREQIKQLVERYPYLAPHNSWTGTVVEDYDYTYTEECGLPEGWQRLFLMLCKNLRPHLEKSSLLDKFYFTQVKEKYGTMRIYTSCLPNSVDHLIDLYESYSKYVCQSCGDIAKYCTRGWVSYLCEQCIGAQKKECEYVKKQKVATFVCYSKNESYRLQYSYKDIRNEYNHIKGMSSDEFLEYLLT